MANLFRLNNNKKHNMHTETKLIQIGNSKGIRIPNPMLLKYQLQELIVIEEVDGGILIRAKDTQRLSWKDTYKEMSQAQEDWSDWHQFEDPHEI